MDITTSEGWREFVDSTYERPARITPPALRRMPSSERWIYNEARARYSQAGAFVKTPQYAAFQSAVRERVYLNPHRQVGKLGLILSGEPGQGKTTTLLQIGKEHELRRRLMGRSSTADGRIPVMYVMVPAQCTAKAMLLEFVRFFALPTIARTTYNSLLEMVANAIRRCGTELILIDDVHHLDLQYRQNLEASDMLKQLSERCGGTFVYAGIAVEATGLLSGSREGQIRKRFELFTASPFTITSAQGQSDWGDLLLALEDSLCLLKQKPGSILEVAKSLHWLTGGEIGPLKDMLQLSAFRAIDSGAERLDTSEFDREVERRRRVMGDRR
ncbi:ATP-binding protein [Microbacterium sp. Root553]|uniref:ATP-binding protein n=1 Tax=Microbacterium sp. Root553 TaxID=1736556 RepID=UPI000700E232|nr:ATP-binding protein [Microbacterium sp. Root553]KQZ23249.1 hypothetical protein ASD43_01860 [Microbacterium sp. Root553]